MKDDLSLRDAQPRAPRPLPRRARLEGCISLLFLLLCEGQEGRCWGTVWALAAAGAEQQ